LRIAIIDLGTNTFNLLLADVDAAASTFRAVHSEKMAVKLGEGGLTDGLIRPEPLQRAKDALSAYMAEVQRQGCDRVLAFGTSAMRDARNADALTRWARTELDLDIAIISGEEEARLITEGVRMAVPMDHRPALIMDIGGGSTEFIIANATDVFWQRSYQLGISRIRQMLQPSDPLSSDDLAAFDRLLADELRDMVQQCQRHGITTLIGSSGSFDSFIEMLWAAQGIHRLSNEVLTDRFDLPELQALHARLLALDFDQRRQIPGLVEMRVDTIHLASHMVQWVLAHCTLTEVLLSTYALKEGVIHRVMQGRGVEAMGPSRPDA
jgi:exopolyphosphatase / guanosine-5'-triphosphate,3'-diphosphate pyrophosphatase